MPTTFRASAFNLAASGCAPCANNGAVEIAKTATISSPFKWRVRMGKLTDAEPGPQSAVPGLGPDLDMTRGDIEEWLSEQSRKAAKQQDDILWWAKAATWVAAIGFAVAAIGIGIAVAIVITALSE